MACSFDVCVNRLKGGFKVQVKKEFHRRGSDGALFNDFESKYKHDPAGCTAGRSVERQGT
jgi:hypothetical protein